MKRKIIIVITLKFQFYSKFPNQFFLVSDQYNLKTTKNYLSQINIKIEIKSLSHNRSSCNILP